MPSKGTRVTVLVVDDEIDMRMLVRAVLDLANHGLTIVGEAAEGDAAVDRWTELDGPPEPDVIILDNRMPGRTGLDVAQEILAKRPDQLIVLFSSFLDDVTRLRATSLGIAACVSKEEIHQLPDVIWKLGSGVA